MDESGTRRSSHAATPAAGAARSIRSARCPRPRPSRRCRRSSARSSISSRRRRAARVGPADADAAARRARRARSSLEPSAGSPTRPSSPTRSARCSRSCVLTERASTTTRSRRASSASSSATTTSRFACRRSCRPRPPARARAAFGVWVEARTRSDYELFRPALEEMVELKHRYVDCFPPADDPYDTLLDDYEPGMKTAEVRDDLRPPEGGADPAHRGGSVVGDAAGDRPLPGGHAAAALARGAPALRLRGHRVADRHRAAPVRDVARRRATSGSRRVSPRIRSTGCSR